MIIYKCVITGDEMFSDIYKIKEIENGILFEVEGKVITRKVGDVDESAIGGNASAEEASESLESTSESGVDIVLNHKLQEMSTYDKKAYMGYIKEYMKAVTKAMSESNPDRVDQFKKDVQPAVKKILEKIKNYQFFSGESMNPDGTLGLLDYREDGITPYMLFFKDGLVIEKC